MEARGASPEGTKRYFERHELAVEPARLGRTRWSVSPVGFGSYRVHVDNPVHREALKLALTSGCNLIDTSTNYTDGGSESLVGRVLGELTASGAVKRDEIVVVTKVGYLQGGNMELARDRLEAGRPYNDIVEYNPDCWHCIDPEFLGDQLSLSLQRLKLETIDVLLLHNPEYFLKVTPDHAAYYQRIEKAFAYLETEVARGRIKYYGISSNTFPDEKESLEFTSLEVVLELAAKVSEKNHFAVIQFPFNLYEQGAAHGLAELARSNDIGTLVNRPLNAYDGHRMIRLADFPSHVGENVSDNFKAAMGRASRIETKYPKEARAIVPLEQIAWAHIIQQNFARLGELDVWKNVLAFQIKPVLAEAFAALCDDSEIEGLREWVADYKKESAVLFEAMTAFLEFNAAILSGEISANLVAACPELATTKTLSQKVIRIYRSIPGIDCVLVGMREPGYVRDALTLEPVLPEEKARKALANRPLDKA